MYSSHNICGCCILKQVISVDVAYWSRLSVWMLHTEAGYQCGCCILKQVISVDVAYWSRLSVWMLHTEAGYQCGCCILKQVISVDVAYWSRLSVWMQLKNEAFVLFCQAYFSCNQWISHNFLSWNVSAACELGTEVKVNACSGRCTLLHHMKVQCDKSILSKLQVAGYS